MNVIRGSQIRFIPAAHEDANNPGVLKRVLATRDDLLGGRVQMLNWARLPGGRAFRPHYHEDMEEIFIVVSGRAEITIDDGHESLEPGDAVLVPIGSVHTMKNVGKDDVEYLVVGITSGEGGKTIVFDEK